jgi:hypothetical protein
MVEHPGITLADAGRGGRRAMVWQLDALLDADGDREPDGRVVWLRPAG